MDISIVYGYGIATYELPELDIERCEVIEKELKLPACSILDIKDAVTELVKAKKCRECIETRSVPGTLYLLIYSQLPWNVKESDPKTEEEADSTLSDFLNSIYQKDVKAKFRIINDFELK